MKFELRKQTIRRKHPLRISRGVAGETLNLFVSVEHEGTVGTGELAPVGYGPPQNADICEAAFLASASAFEPHSPGSIHEVERLAFEIGLPSSARAALNMACWDWLGKKLRAPLWQLFGLPKQMAHSSITVGILPPEEIGDRVRELLAESGCKIIKQKLGGQDGIEADKARYMAAREAAPPGVPIRVDANGGWSLHHAQEMMSWLAERGCAYVEQPIHFENVESLKPLYESRALPIFYDELVGTACDAARYLEFCDGVNVKLLKSGGISEAMRIVAVCRAMGKQTMIGCFSESSIAISAAASIGALFDHIDLDSHLNQDPDPAIGLQMEDGMLVLTNEPGLGVRLK